MAQENLNSAKREQQEAENHVRATESVLTRAKQALTRHDRDAREIRQHRQRLEDRIEQLQAELDADAVNDTSALDELHAQFNDAEEALKAANDSMVDSVSAMDQLGSQNRAVKEQLDAATREVEEAQARLDKARKRLEEKSSQREFALRKKNEALAMVEVAQQEKEALEAQRTEQERIIREEYLPGATEVSARVNVEPGHTVEVLDRKLEKLEQEHKRFQDRFVESKRSGNMILIHSSIGGNREQIYARWRAAHKAFTNAQRDLNGQRDVAKVS